MSFLGRFKQRPAEPDEYTVTVEEQVVVLQARLNNQSRLLDDTRSTVLAQEEDLQRLKAAMESQARSIHRLAQTVEAMRAETQP